MIISILGKGQNKTTEKKLIQFVGIVSKLKIEIHKGIEEQGKSKAKFLRQMLEISNSKGYFLLAASQIMKKKTIKKHWNKAVPKS